MEYSLLFCTCPDEAIALSLAKQVVEAKLAACVNVVPHLHSVYRWKNSIETSKEVLMIIKTKSQTYKALENFLTEAHPYECPEIIACAITQGSPKYLQWIDEALANPV
jgi:periplasmic divalent cation tolerance protein